MSEFFDALSELNKNHYVKKSCEIITKVCHDELSFVTHMKYGKEAHMFLCDHRSLMKRVVLRIPTMPVYSDEEARSRFCRGGRTQSMSKARGAGVPEVYDMKEGRGKEPCYIILEYIPGLNLFEYMSESKSLGSNTDRVNLFRKILYTVKMMHDGDVIHRDLKPENILIKTTTKNPYILDFGLSKQRGKHSMTSVISSSGLGTPLYVAPEQWKNLMLADERSDIYSLGRIFYVLLSGHILEDIQEEYDFDLLPEGNWGYIIQKATNKKAKKRYQSIAEFLEDINIEMAENDLFDDEAINNDSSKFKNTMRLKFLVENDQNKAFNIFDPKETSEEIRFIHNMILLDLNPGRFMAIGKCGPRKYQYYLSKCKEKLKEAINNTEFSCGESDDNSQ